MSAGSRRGEGLVGRAEIASGLYLAESLVKVNNGHIITSFLDTRKQDAEVQYKNIHSNTGLSKITYSLLNDETLLTAQFV